MDETYTAHYSNERDLVIKMWRLQEQVNARSDDEEQAEPLRRKLNPLA